MIDEDEMDEDPDYGSEFDYSEDFYDDVYSMNASKLVLLKDQVPMEKQKPRMILSCKKYWQFKQFDVVDSFPDHFFDKQGTSEVQYLLKVSESRMQLLRAAIIGPQGTPYHDGLFFFDCSFPDNYPASPPKVYYHSGGH
ncbi:putative ubiquitin-conjugating enzyme E2 38 [Arachis stenosperma]|uniref:putative ubiquitin-conjugating enzyme E2 38 n=1 Tax=Arachis stenosperma TaxID=217475 RepID=UPI0025AD587C|nr:putative ubiquitin-conjugating enzyme E2 38 [Arachis stenosperma]